MKEDYEELFENEIVITPKMVVQIIDSLNN